MIEIKLDNGTTLKIPSDQSEITLRQFEMAAGFARSMSDLKDEVTDADWTDHVLNTVSALTGESPEKLAELDYGMFEELGSAGGLFPVEDISLIRLCNYLTKLINEDPEPVSFPIGFAGEQWTVSDMNGILSDIHAGMKTGEVIEAMQLKKDFARIIDEAKAAAVDFTQLSNLYLELDSMKTAILLRRPGEKLPILQSELRKFVANRGKLFQDLPYSVFNQVAFFLKSTLTVFSITHHLGTIHFSGTDENPNQPILKVPGTQKKMPGEGLRLGMRKSGQTRPGRKRASS